jgi:hypothetical protein
MRVCKSISSNQSMPKQVPQSYIFLLVLDMPPSSKPSLLQVRTGDMDERLSSRLVRCSISHRVRFMTAREINTEAAREVHPLKSIGCFIKKPITAEELIKRIKAELM